jgi:hypothetical protein
MSDIDLSIYDDDYDEAEIIDNNTPDGIYQVYVDEVVMKETKESKEPMLAWKLKIINGKREGCFIFKNSVVKDTTLGFIKTDLSICGLTLSKFSEIYLSLESLLRTQLEIKVVTKGEYQNIYFQKKLDLDEEGNLKDTDTVSDDDIPF